ncbi:MAG: response regulator [Rhodoferax sp.]|nr:response regulator [Rhodoferax sp.]
MRFNDLPLRRKLLLIAALAPGLALALHLLVQFGLTVRNSQAAEESRLHAIAQVIAASGAAALQRDDPLAGAGTLAALRSRPEIVRAVLLRADGSVLAEYPGPTTGKAPGEPPATTLQIRGGLLQGAMVFEQPLQHAGAVRGRLRIDTDLTHARQRLYEDLALALISAAVALGLVLLGVMRLLRPAARRDEPTDRHAPLVSDPAPLQSDVLPRAPDATAQPTSAPPSPAPPVLLAMAPGTRRDALAAMFTRSGTPVVQHDSLGDLLAWMEGAHWPTAALVVLDTRNSDALQAGCRTLRDHGIPDHALLLMAPPLAPGATATLDNPALHAQMPQSVNRLVTGFAAPPGVANSPATCLHARVLLAEDNQVNREIATAMMLAMDCKVTQAHDGAQALAAALTRDIDLVLMDCQMPVMDGFEATRRIRAWEQDQPGRPRLPIVALTANALAGDREACLAAGMDDYLVKPVSSSRLAETLARHLSGHGRPSPAPALPPMDAQLAAITTPPVYDPGVLASLPMVADGTHPHFVRDMQRLFAESNTRTLAEIDAAMAKADAQLLLRLLHSMKSASAQVGAMEVSALARDYEHALRAGRPPAVHWPAQLRQAFERLLAAWPDGMQAAERLR